jgi:purine nucleoside permease
LTKSPQFDLRKTYFLIAGVAGISPNVGAVGSIIFARFAVQVDLQYQFDACDVPPSWQTSYVPQGIRSPDQYPTTTYGVEVFEVNKDLRDLIRSEVAGKIKLENPGPEVHGGASSAFKAANMAPSVIEADADVASSTVFFHGSAIAHGFEKFFKLLTNDQGVFAMTAQEDTALLAALLRAALVEDRVDFSRIIVMRVGSNFNTFTGALCLEHRFVALQKADGTSSCFIFETPLPGCFSGGPPGGNWT